MKNLRRPVPWCIGFFLMLSTAAFGQWTTTRVTDNSTDESNLRMAVDASGEVHLVYRATVGKGRKATFKIFYTKKLVTGEFTSPVRVTDTPNRQDEFEPELAVDENGVHVVFRLEEEKDVYSLYYALFNGSAVTPVEFFDGAGEFPEIAIDGNGLTNIVFAFADGSRKDVYFTHDFGPPVNVTASRAQ